MSPFDTKPSESFTFSSMLPTAEKEDTFSNTLPAYTRDGEDTFSNTIPAYTRDGEDTFSNAIPAYTRNGEDTFSNTIPTDPKDSATSTALSPAEARTNRRILFSHIAASIFAIPALILISLDLHYYDTRPPTTVPFQHGQFSTISSLLVLDIMSVILLSLTLLYASAFLKLRQQKAITLRFLHQHAISIFMLDALLCVGVQALSDTIIGMRTGPDVRGCQRFMFLDPNACESGRRTIMRTAGAMGILTGIAIHIRWVTSMHILWYRGRYQKDEVQ